ncbi:MAG: ATP-binding protein [Pirellulaceae bacterium]
MSRSLHMRLVILTGVFSAISILVFGLVVCILVESSLWHQFDTSLHDRLIHLTQLIEQADGTIEFEWDETEKALIRAEGEQVACWIDGQLIRNLPEPSPPIQTPIDFQSERPFSTTSDGRPGRGVAIVFQPRSEGPNGDGTITSVTLALARPTTNLNAIIGILRWSLAAAALFAVSFTLLGTWVVVKRGLVPIQGMTREIESISPDNLTRTTLKIDHQPTELAPLLSTINSLLARLNIAMERERALSSEIAHELRTPLAGLNAKIETALSKPRSGEELIQTLAECRQINDSTTKIVDTLLATASNYQCDSTNWQAINVTQLLEECLLQFDARMTEMGIEVKHSLPDGIKTLGDRHSLEIAFRNLLDNAVSYADQNSAIEVSCNESNNFIEIHIRNRASNFPAEQIDNVFERFWRADASRSHSEFHCGLGLSLVRKIITAHEGTVTAQYRHPHFLVTIRLKRLTEKSINETV